MKYKMFILPILALVMCVWGGVSCSPDPSCQCCKENQYRIGTWCIRFLGNYGTDMDTALDSLLCTAHYDLSQYANYYFVIDTLNVLNHPDSFNRLFFFTRFYVNGNVITGHKYDMSYFDECYSVACFFGGDLEYYWIIDTKGDVYDFDEIPDD